MSVQPHPQWAAPDRLRAASANPAVFGVAERALDLLREHGGAGGEPAGAAADRLADRIGAAGTAPTPWPTNSPGNSPGQPADPLMADLLGTRAAAHRACLDATSALVAAGGGGAMALTAPAQRLARTALFLLVQAQSADARAATLATYG